MLAITVVIKQPAIIYVMTKIKKIELFRLSLIQMESNHEFKKFPAFVKLVGLRVAHKSSQSELGSVISLAK